MSKCMLLSVTLDFFLIISSKLTKNGIYVMQDATAAGRQAHYSWVQNRKVWVVATEIAGSPWSTGLSALLKQDLKLINVPKAVCSLASLRIVSFYALDCLPLASSSKCSDNTPAGIQHWSCMAGQIKIVSVVGLCIEWMPNYMSFFHSVKFNDRASAFIHRITE